MSNLEDFAKRANQHHKAVGALSSNDLEALSRGEPFDCQGCGEEVSLGGKDNLVITTTMGAAVYHDFCHEALEGYGWAARFPLEGTRQALVEWAERLLAGQGWTKEADGWRPADAPNIRMETLEAAYEALDAIDFEEGQAFIGALEWSSRPRPVGGGILARMVKGRPIG